jgi:hypothetical protein
MRRLLGLLIGSAMVLASVGAASASAATVVVRPSAMDSWATQTRDPGGVPVAANDPYCHGSVTFVTGPATPPLGVGSAELKTGNGTTGGDCSAELRNSAYSGVKLSALTALGYWTYDVSNNGQQFPYLELNIDTTGTGTGPDDAIFFEPPYQTPTTGNPALPDQGAAVMNEWQSWDALDGGWWANSGGGSGTTGCTPGAPSGPNTGVCSLADYISQHPNARILNSSTGGGVHLVVGFASATDQFDGNVDAFRIATSSSDTTYDFEPNLPTPTSKDQCKEGGWQNYADANGTPFKNQGDCVSYVATGGKNKANS